MIWYSTLYNDGDSLFGEEVGAPNEDDAKRQLLARGLGERLEDSLGRSWPSTTSALAEFDRGNFAAAAHSACQLVRLRNNAEYALVVLSDHGLIHELLHLQTMPDEPIVQRRRPELRAELAALEAHVRPGLNTGQAQEPT